MSLSNKTVCFVDNGLFVPFARKVAPAFGHAFYYSPWEGAFPKQHQTRLGDGFPELERCNAPLLVADEIDLWVFFDIFSAGLQLFLEQHGAKVWGARLGEELETERHDFKTFCDRAGIDVPPTEFITGTDALKKFLKGKKRKFIKLVHGDGRGNMETWLWKDEHISERRLELLIYDLGSFGPSTEFAVQDEVVDSVELAEDTYCVDGKFPSTVVHGLEVKGLGLIGKVKPYEELPKALRDVNVKLASVFKKDRFRSAFSLEGLLGKDKKYRVTDPCCRFGSPSNELLQVIFKNWAEIFYEGAQGHLVEPEPTAKYGFIMSIVNEASGKEWQPISYPKEVEPWVCLRFPYRVGKEDYFVPQGAPTAVGRVVGIGDTLLEAASKCVEHAKQVDGNQIEIPFGVLDKSLDAVDKLEGYGVEFTKDPLPSVEELKKLTEE